MKRTGEKCRTSGYPAQDECVEEVTRPAGSVENSQFFKGIFEFLSNKFYRVTPKMSHEM